MILVGAVSQLYQGDFDFGRRAIECLVHADLGPGVRVEDLSYGAVAVTLRLEELRPAALVLVGAARRGREPGSVERREIASLPVPPEQVQRAVVDAVTGYVDIDLVVEVAHGLGALPARTIAIEVEPSATEPSEHLSPEAEGAVAEVVELVRAEVSRVRDAL